MGAKALLGPKFYSEQQTESEENYRLLVDNLGEGVAYVDPDEIFTFANPAAESIFGVPPGRLVGRSLLDFVAIDIHPLIRNEAAMRRTDRKSRYDHEIVRADGKVRCLEVTATPQFGPDGRFLGTFAVFWDITDRRRNEDQLKLLAHAVNSTTDGICVLDTQGTARFANKSFLTMFGLRSEDIGGQSLAQSVWMDVPVETLLAETLARGFWQGEVIARRKDGSESPLLLSTSIVRDEKDQPLAVVGICQDITERKRAETEARKRAADLELAKVHAESANRAKSEFLAKMSHEIRTPMNGVIGMSGLLLDTKLDLEQRAYAETIRASADSLLTIIDDILDLSKIEAGRVQLESAPFEIVRLIQQAGKLIAPRAAEKGLDFHFRADTPDCWVLGDAGRLRQVVLNLLGNAVKFTDRGAVELAVTRAETTDGRACMKISVKDTGIGIASAKVPLLFQEFEQVDSSLRRRHQGAGLGLAMCRQLSELRGASISVISEPGHGSTFTITLTLPVTAAEPSERVDYVQPVPRPTPPPRARRVLLAEDNIVNQAVASRILEKLGCVVDIAANGREAVNMSRQVAYDLIFMDCMMPEVDGYRATGEIRMHESGHSVPIVALTADALEGSRQECLTAGMDDYLTKPISAERIQSALLRWSP